MRIAEFPLNPMFAKMLLESGGWSLAAPFDSMLVSLNSVHQGRGTNHGLKVAAAVKGLFLPNDEMCVCKTQCGVGYLRSGKLQSG